MCGRFAQVYDDTALKKKFRLEDISERIQPRFNLSPGMNVNTVTGLGTDYKLSVMEWGFSEIHGKSLPSLIFNSRSDTLSGNSHLGQYLIKHRCIIPVSGFYEWNEKQPYYVRYPDRITCLAGVFIPDAEVNRCSVVTVDSSGPLKNIHHRMPLILNDIQIKLWLNDEYPAEQDIICDLDGLDCFKVSCAVNDAGFESEDCIIPFRENSLF